MLTLNRILRPTLFLALFAVQVALFRAERLDGAAIVLALQAGIAVFIYADWVKPKP